MITAEDLAGKMPHPAGGAQARRHELDDGRPYRGEGSPARERQGKILALLAVTPGLRAKQIASALDDEFNRVYSAINTLRLRGAIASEGRGRRAGYRLVEA